MAGEKYIPIQEDSRDFLTPNIDNIPQETKIPQIIPEKRVFGAMDQTKIYKNSSPHYADRRDKAGPYIRELLTRLHHTEGMTLEDMERELGFSQDSLIKTLRMYGVERKPVIPRSLLRTYNDVLSTLWANPQAVQNLTEAQKEVISKRYLSDPEKRIPTLQEIADELGISKQAVQIREKRALKKLRKTKEG